MIGYRGVGVAYSRSITQKARSDLFYNVESVDLVNVLSGIYLVFI